MLKRKFKKTVSVLLSLCLVLTMFTGISFAVSATGDVEVSRLYGKSRYDTSFEVADALKAELNVEKFETVLIADGNNFPDALSGSYLAAKKDAPILMVNGESADNIAKLHAYIKENVVEDGTIYILGGTGAVSEAVETGLEDYDVIRLFGKSRYDTNLEILKEAGAVGEDILVCTGNGFADSLSASAAGKPILLVDSNKGISDDQRFFLESSTTSDTQIYVIGGTGAVSKEVESILSNFADVTRISGKNRYITSVTVAETFCKTATDAVVAYGGNFPDGLCGGPLAFAKGASLILTVENSESAASEYFASNGITGATILGGTGVLPENVIETIMGVGETVKPDETVYKLTVTHHDPEASAAGTFLNNWAAEVEKESKGRIDIVIHHGGSIAGPKDSIDAVLGGTVDIAWGLQSYYAGQFPVTEVFALPCLDIDSAVEGSEALWNFYTTTDYMDAEYSQYHVLYLHTDCQSAIATVDKKIEQISDVNGMAIRISSGPPVSFVSELGASPEGCSINDLYSNLDKGVYDGCITNWETIGRFNFYETIQFFLDENVGVSTYFMFMNPDSYAELPEDLQAILDEVSADAGKYTVSWDEAEAAVKAQEGVAEKLYTLSETERAKLEDAAETVTGTWIKNMENGQEIYDAAMKCIAEAKK